MRFLPAVWPLPLLVLGAAGLSSGIGDDTFCGLTVDEGLDYGAHRTLWPPGEVCHVGATVAHSGSAASFFGALACGLLVWIGRRRLPVTWCAALLVAATGAIAWELSLAPAAFVWPLLLGPPVVAVATRSYLRAAAATAALVLAGVLWLALPDVVGFGLALLVVAALEAIPPLRRPQPA